MTSVTQFYFAKGIVPWKKIQITLTALRAVCTTQNAHTTMCVPNAVRQLLEENLKYSTCQICCEKRGDGSLTILPLFSFMEPY